VFSPPLGRGIKWVGLFIVNLQMIRLSTNQILRKMPRNVRRVFTPSREGDKGGGSFHRERSEGSDHK